MAVPAGRGGAHRGHLRVRCARAARVKKKPEGERLPQREDRQDPGAAARLRVRLLRSAGRHRGRARAPRCPGDHLQPAQRRQRSSRCCTRWLRWWAAPTTACAGWKACATGWSRSRPRGAHCLRPRVYFEEWDEPPISGIRWVSRLVGIAGGDDIFRELAVQPLGKDRIVTTRRDRPPQSGHRRRVLVRQEVPARESGRAPGLGRRSTPCAIASCSRSSRPTSCSPDLRR